MNQPKNCVQQLTEYIIKNLTKGYTLDALRVSLINQGYSRVSINNAIDSANKQLAERIPPIKEKPQIIYKVIEEDIQEKRGFFKFIKRIFRRQ